VLREEILTALRADVDRAKEQAGSATEHFQEVIHQLPSGLPHPDVVHRIRNASIEYSAAQARLKFALSRLNSFVLHGTVPEDLRPEADA